MDWRQRSPSGLPGGRVAGLKACATRGRRYNLSVRIVSSAPTRIDLAGGTIDIWPLYLFHDGALTLNAAISLRAHADIESRDSHDLELRSIDTDRVVTAKGHAELDPGGELPLLALLAKHYRLEGATLTTRGESPAGAGIAGSSALVIACCGALARWTRRPTDPDHLLQVAMNVECQTIKVPTGVQDYRPALYGGIAAIELRVQRARAPQTATVNADEPAMPAPAGDSPRVVSVALSS